MDLLGSILGSMDPIPTAVVDEETKKKVREAKVNAAKFKDTERKRKANFKAQIESRINTFLQTPPEEKKLVFEAMNKFLRSITHEAAEVAGLASYSFGEEDVDRHLIVWKKENAPCEAELDAIRKGEEYDPEKAAAEEKLRAESMVIRERESRKRHTNPAAGEQEKYFEKYAKIIGENSGLDAAHATKTNKSYGMVPSSNKEDTRSIEETMKEIRERKIQRQKMEEEVKGETSTTNDVS